MTDRQEMLHGVFVFGCVTAYNVAANHAHPKLRPLVPKDDTLFADICVGRERLDLIKMATLLFPKTAGKHTSENQVDHSHIASLLGVINTFSDLVSD